MSATRPSSHSRRAEPVRRASARLELRARRRLARRRQRIARIDVAIGVAGALVLILATPGLAMAGAIALLVLALCGASWLLERRRRSREAVRRASRPRRR